MGLAGSWYVAQNVSLMKGREKEKTSYGTAIVHRLIARWRLEGTCKGFHCNLLLTAELTSKLL